MSTLSLRLPKSLHDLARQVFGQATATERARRVGDANVALARRTRNQRLVHGTSAAMIAPRGAAGNPVRKGVPQATRPEYGRVAQR